MRGGGGGGEFRGPGVQFGGSPGFQAALGWFGVPPQAVQGSSGWGGVGRGGSGPPPLCVAWGPHRCFGVSLSPPPPPAIWGSVSLQPVWGGAPVPVRQFKWVPEEAPPTLYFWGALTYFLIVLLPGLGVVGLAGGGGLGGLPLDGGGGGGGRLPRHRPRRLLVVVRVVGGPGGVGVRRRRRFAWGGPQKKNKG